MTDCAIEHEMWVMPASEFLLLSEIRPHEELVAEGKLVRYDASHVTVFYISHQWTSTKHPDYSTAQLWAFQSFLLRMVHGNMPETTPTYSEAVRMPSNIKIGTHEWRTLVKDAFIWMDYLSLPQNRPTGQTQSGDITANSIADCIARCSHFFAVCPTVQSREDKMACNYGTWLESGACRFELFALLLAQHYRIPAIVSCKRLRRTSTIAR